MKLCLMALNILGQWMVCEVLDTDDDNTVNLKFHTPDKCYDTNDIEYTAIPDNGYENCCELLNGDMVLPIVYEVISPGQFIGLWPNTGAYEDLFKLYIKLSLRSIGLRTIITIWY